MSTKSSGFRLVAEYADRSVVLDLPSRIFSPLAEQLRWDSLRAGYVNPDEWFTAKAHIAPAITDKSEPTQVVISLLKGNGDKISKCYDISKWQGLSLFLGSVSPSFAGSCVQPPEKIKLCWVGDQAEFGVPVPLCPLCVPVEKLPIKVGTTSQLAPLNLVISEDVSSALVELSKETLRLEVELGGCLVGRMSDLNTVVITEVLLASISEASAGQFSFKPRFWLDVNARLAGTGLRMLGWHHSHLCDKGFPESLSVLDFWIFYKHFVAPWSVAALVCASIKQPQVNWFGWQDGSIVSLKPSYEPSITKPLTGEIPCKPQR